MVSIENYDFITRLLYLFGNIRYLFRIRSESAVGTSLLSCCQQGTLLREVQPSAMTDGALNIYLHILEIFR